MRFPTTIPRAAQDRFDLPPTASLPSVIQTLACRVRPLEYLEWCRRRLGPRFTVYPIDMPPLVFLADSQDIRAVVTAPLDILHPGAGANVTAPLFGEDSFILRDEEDYLSGRNAIIPAFHRHVVLEHRAMIEDLASNEVSTWPLDTPTPIHARLRVLALTAMLRAVFDHEDPTIDSLRDALLAMLSVTASLVLQEPRLNRLPVWRTTWKRFVKHRDEVDQAIACLIAQRRACAGTHHDMLEMLLEASLPDGTPMSEKELRDNLVSVITAGHETTASSLAWAFQLLAHHPIAQDRLIAEIDQGDSEDYLTATVNEVMRHRPVFLFTVPRAIAQPIEISGCIYQPPAHLLGCTYLMHHDPMMFDHPHEFRPERFLQPPATRWVWLPWGGGWKTCPGRHLALLEMRTVLRATLSEYRILPASRTIERAAWRSVIVTPHAGSRIVLRKLHSVSRRAKSRPTPFSFKL
jgi:cytochrome P450